MKNDLRTLNGKIAVVTGGTRGIGKAIADALSSTGADVVRIARSGADISADVADEAAVKKAVKAVGKRFKKIDILINAAGIHGAIGFFSDAYGEKWCEAFMVNFFGTANMIHAALPFLKNSKRGKIINFSGGGAVTDPRPLFSAYGVSKAAVVRLTENLAVDFKREGHAIDVNAIAPGAVATRLLDEVARFEKIDPRSVEVTPRKAIDLCLFLASQESDGLSGKLISAVHDDWRSIPSHLKEIMNSDVYGVRRIKPKDRGYEW